MFKIKCWWNKKEKYYIKKTVGTFAIRCRNCRKETMIDLNILETDYQEIITTFVLNIMLHHVGMIWIIENHEDLEYDMKSQHSYWMPGGPW